MADAQAQRASLSWARISLAIVCLIGFLDFAYRGYRIIRPSAAQSTKQTDVMGKATDRAAELSPFGDKTASDHTWQRAKDCAEQTARVAVRAHWVEGQANGGFMLSSWENHYSPKYEKCFIRVNYMKTGANKDRNVPIAYSILWDAFEARELADCTDMADSGHSAYCSINGDASALMNCSTCGEFVKDRMEN